MKKILLTCALLGGISQQLAAQNWTGNVNNNWNNSANWTGWPLNGDDLVIDPANFTGAAASPVISANSAFTPNTITVQNGGSLVISANISTGDNVEVTGAGSSLLMQGGTFNVGPGNDGRLIIDLGGTLTMNGGTLNVDQRFITGEDATTTLHAGTVTAGQRLLLDLGGVFIQNGGSITVGETMALADGNAAGSCHYIMNGGTLLVNGELNLENELGNFKPTLDLRGGNLHVNGDLNWFGEAPGSGMPELNVSGGLLRIDGLLQNMAGSTVNMKMHILDTGSVIFQGPQIIQLYATDSIIQSGQSSFLFMSTPSTWNNAGVFFSSGDAFTTFYDTHQLNGNGLYQFANIVISPNAVLDHVNPAEIGFSGDMVINGTFSHALNRLTANGSTAQDLISTDPGGQQLYELRMQNGPGGSLRINRNLNISHHLDLLSGNIHTDQNSRVVILPGATSVQGSAASFVNGPVEKRGSSAFVFPVGKNNTWRRIGTGSLPSANSAIVAEYFDTAHTPLTPVGAPVTQVSPAEYWTLREEGAATGNDPLPVTLYWEDASASGITGCASLYGVSWSGMGWTSYAGTATGTCTGNGAGSFSFSHPALHNNPNGYALSFGYTGQVTTENITLCHGDSISINGTTYHHSASFSNLYSDVNGNDSTVITVLTVLPQLMSVQNITRCAGEAYIFNGHTYTQSGVYTDTLLSVNACDSIVTTHLSIPLNPPAHSQSITLCAGGSYAIGNHVYTLSGIYTDTLTTAGGCDSTVTTTLTVQPQIDVNVTLSGATLSATNTGADAYQWIICGGAPVSGAVSGGFSPAGNGSYAVIIMEGSCSDTSACVTVNTVGLKEPEVVLPELFPNPVRRGENLQLKGLKGKETITVYDSKGLLLQNLRNTSQDTVLIPGTGTWSRGMYLVRIHSENGRYTTLRCIVH